MKKALVLLSFFLFFNTDIHANDASTAQLLIVPIASTNLALSLDEKCKLLNDSERAKINTFHANIMSALVQIPDVSVRLGALSAANKLEDQKIEETECGPQARKLVDTILKSTNNTQYTESERTQWETYFQATAINEKCHFTGPHTQSLFIAKREEYWKKLEAVMTSPESLKELQQYRNPTVHMPSNVCDNDKARQTIYKLRAETIGEDCLATCKTSD